MWQKRKTKDSPPDLLQVYVKFTGRNLADHAWLKKKAFEEGRTLPQQVLALIGQAQVAEAHEKKILGDLAVTATYLDQEHVPPKRMA